MARWGDRKRGPKIEYETSPPPKGPLMASIPIPIPTFHFNPGEVGYEIVVLREDQIQLIADAVIEKLLSIVAFDKDGRIKTVTEERNVQP
jgi:hypothetical protein